MGSIYKITNTVNGKAYIGQTRQDAEKTRIRDHFTGRGNEGISDDLAKYGKDAFTYEILHDGIIPEFLDTLEKEVIAKFNTVSPHGYNLRAGGGGGSPSLETRRKISESLKGKTFSKETCRKLSEAAQGRKLSEETRRKLSEANIGENHPNYGKSHSEETRRKISQANTGEKNHLFGKQLSPEHRRKISKANIGRKHSGETRRKMSVHQKSPEHCRKISEAKKGKKYSQEAYQNIAEANRKHFKGKKLSAEHCRKISEANTGKQWSPEARKRMSEVSKNRSPEHRRKLSEANETPERIAARKYFFSLQPDMNLKEKRKCLRQRFPNKCRHTIYRWCKKFDSETQLPTN